MIEAVVGVRDDRPVRIGGGYDISVLVVDRDDLFSIRIDRARIAVDSIIRIRRSIVVRIGDAREVSAFVIAVLGDNIRTSG